MGRKAEIGNAFARVRCDVERGKWEVSFARGGLGFRDVRAYADINRRRRYTTDAGMRHSVRTRPMRDRFGRGRQLVLVSRPGGRGVEIHTMLTIYDTTDAVLSTVKIVNKSSGPVEIGSVSGFFIESGAAPCLDLGGDFADYRIFLDDGCMARAVVRKLRYPMIERRYHREAHSGVFNDWVEGDHEHRAMGICAFFNPAASKGLVVSFLSFAKARSEIRTEFLADRAERILAEEDFVDFKLGRGRHVECDPLWIAATDAPLDAMEDYARHVKQWNRVKIKEAPTGFCSWYPKGFRDHITEAKILKAARAIRRHFDGFGIRWIQLDLGWFDGNIPGEYTRPNKAFPHGMKWLARELKKLGFELGLWYCPNTVSEYASIFKRSPQLCLQDGVGKPAPRHLGQWTWAPHGHTYDLDPTRPEVKRFLERTYKRALAWGCTYFKNDFLEQVGRTYVEHSDGKVVKGVETYRRLLKIIKDAVKDRAYVLGCSCLTSANVGLVDGCRIAADIGVGRKYGRYEHLRTTYTTMINRWFLNGNFWVNDPDPLLFENCDMNGARIRTTAVGLSGGAFMLGDNMAVRCRDERFVKLFKMCLPVYPRSARPVDLFESEYPRIWDLPVTTRFGAWHVTALMNFEAGAEAIRVDFRKLGLAAGKEYIVWERWGERLLGVHREGITVRVEGTATKLLCIKEFVGRPDVISTDMHISQGGVELEVVRWDGRGQVLSGVCRRPRGERGTLFVYVPQGFRAGSVSVDGVPSPGRVVRGRVARIHLDFADDRVEWSVSFAGGARRRG